MYELTKNVVVVLLYLIIAVTLIKGIKSNEKFSWIKDKWGNKGVLIANVLVIIAASVCAIVTLM